MRNRRAKLVAKREDLLQTCLALLRGINLGAKNRLPMKDLSEMFARAGCRDVETYIQSGNVIFRATPNVSARLSQVIRTQIQERFGHQVPVVLRTAEQLRNVVRNNPFLIEGAAEDTLHVMFLADWPDPDRVNALDPVRSPPDAFMVRGQEVYLRLPNGVARSKLTNSYFDSKLGTISTARNWRTVTRLLQLTEEQDSC
ncbi:MAG TPA: DUF1697 domain-containing protein [Terriglobia bacterium]